MEELKKYTKSLLNEIKTHCIESLIDRPNCYGCDLHNELFNTSYFIVGTYNAKQWIDRNFDDVFDAIDIVVEYEKFTFGELTSDITNPETLANLLAYIVGEQILYLSDHLTYECWDRYLTDEDYDVIIQQLEDLV